VADALTAPFCIAALVVGVAGVAKLRAPAVAADALRRAGLPSAAILVRLAGTGELALAAWSILAPGRAVAAVLGLTYATFAGLALVLASRSAACGCFGEQQSPASRGHSILNAALALVCGLGVVWPPSTMFGRPAAIAAPLVVGVLGAAYATVLAYTELPRAWSAWGRR
jgi:hypothetical protein